MTSTQKGIVAVIAVTVIVLAARFWLQEHDGRLKAEATQAAQQQVIDASQKIIDKAKADQAQTASDLKAQLAAIANQRTVIVTPQQAAAAIPSFVPNLPQPVQVQTVPATATSPATEALIIPQADIPAFQKYKLDCDESSARLLACNKDAVNFQAELSAGQDQFKAMTKERDQWRTAAKGGSLLHRLGRKAKCLAISGGASALGAWADKQQPARGAMIGATAGGVGCEIF